MVERDLGGLLPQVVAGQADVLPARRCDMGQQLIGRRDPRRAEELNGPLAAKPDLSLRDFSGQPFIGYAPILVASYSNLVLEAFRQAGGQPMVVQDPSHTLSIVTLATAGVGLGIGPPGCRTCRCRNWPTGRSANCRRQSSSPLPGLPARPRRWCSTSSASPASWRRSAGALTGAIVARDGDWRRQTIRPWRWGPSSDSLWRRGNVRFG